MITRAQARVRLTRKHVDDMGFVNHRGELVVWHGVAGLPNGARVYLDLGPARHVSSRVLDICRQHLGPESELVIEGPRPDVVAAFYVAAGVAR